MPDAHAPCSSAPTSSRAAPTRPTSSEPAERARRARPRRLRGSPGRRRAALLARAGRARAAVVDRGPAARRARGDGAARPVVATPVGGTPEVVVDGETGLLVPPRDPEALAAALRRSSPTRDLRRRLGRGGRARASRERFSARRDDARDARDLRRGRALRVTAAITTYNRAPFLPGRARERLRADAARRTRCSSSTTARPTTRPTCSTRYGDRIRVVRQENGGRSARPQHAPSERRAAELALVPRLRRPLDADKLERQVPVLEGDDGVALVHGHVDVIGADDELLPDETDAAPRAVQRRAPERRHVRRATRSTAAASRRRSRCASTRSATSASYDPALLLDDYDLYLRLALDREIVFLEGPADGALPPPSRAR